MAARAQGRRRHAARHARGRAATARAAATGTASGATFLFSLGPDHTGRAIRRVFRPGFVGKVQRTSVVGTTACARCCTARCCPGPDIGRRAASVHATRARRRLRDRHPLLGPRPLAGRRGERRRRDGREREMQRACERFVEIFGEPPMTHGAAGWQMNVHALRLTQQLGFDLLLGRPRHASAPAGLERRAHPLPAVADDAADARRADRHRRRSPRTTSRRHLLERTRRAVGDRPCVHAARGARGQAAARRLRAVADGWKAQGWSLGPLRELHDAVEPLALPRCEAALGAIPGRTGTLLDAR